MGQIVIRNQKPKYCNLTAIITGSKKDYILPSGEIWLVDTTNSSKTNGSGKYDKYIIGDDSHTASYLATNALMNIDNAQQIEIDSIPTSGSNNAVSSGGVYQAVQNIDVTSQISGKEDKSNKVTSFNSPTDTQYPSAKLVSDQLATKQDVISDLSTIRSGASAGTTAYQKPETGIPPTDLASAIQTSLGKADTAIQSVTVGTTTTGAAGSSASVTNTGTATEPVLSFTIPQGAQGIQGIQGPQGERGPQGNTGVQVDSVASIIHSIDPTATYAAADVAGADAVQDVLAELTELEGELIDDEIVLAKVLNRHNDAIKEIHEQLPSSYMGEDEELTVARALVDLYENGGGNSSGGASVSGVVTFDNSDTIAIIGASFTDASTPDKGKDWTSMLSAMTDYNYINNSLSGSNPLTRLNSAVRAGYVKGRYAMIPMFSGNGLTTTHAIKIVPIWCDTLESFGIEPIMCSPYNVNEAIDSWMKDYAKQKNYYYYPCREYYDLTRKGRSKVGDSGYHLGTYSIGAWYNGYILQAAHIDRPNQSLKLFRVRSASASKSLDELVFHTNEERFKNFREIYFGELKGGNEYKNITSGVSFDSIALITAVLPVNCADLTALSLKLNATDGVSVYVLNTIAEPYPKIVNYARFSVESEVVLPESGAVYSDGTSNYTVVSTILGENGMYATIYCTPNVSATGGAGSLTKISGNGASTIPYSMVESASMSLDNAVASDTGGHWEALAGINGIYSLSLFDGKVHLDKVHFLVTYNGSFTISGVSVTYEGRKLKNYKAGYHIEFDSNEYHNVQEYIQEPTFGNTGTTLEHWEDSDGNAVVSQAGYDSNYIFDNSVVMLSDADSMTQTVSMPTGKYYLEIMSRYWNETVTEDSYDFSTLYVDITSIGNTGSYSCRQSDEVGLYPKISRFPIDVTDPKDVTIKLYSTNKGLEVFKVSLKKY